MELFFDTETTGLFNFKKSYKDSTQPQVIQLGFILSDSESIYHEGCFILHTDKEISPGALATHHISNKIIKKIGFRNYDIINIFITLSSKANIVVCHNVAFDLGAIKSTLYSKGCFKEIKILENFPTYCTMQKGTNLCKLPGRYGNYKWPKLEELYKFLFNEEPSGAHNALEDAKNTRKCYYKMIEKIK